MAGSTSNGGPARGATMPFDLDKICRLEEGMWPRAPNGRRDRSPIPHERWPC